MAMEFKKGTTTVHYFKMIASSWSSGGTLWFTAKPSPDNDSGDARAIIRKSFTDGSVTDETINGVAYKTYSMTFLTGDVDVEFSSGESVKTYIGEFEFISSGAEVITFPEDNSYIDVILYADIKRG